jgi:hypothetical protein
VVFHPEAPAASLRPPTTGATLPTEGGLTCREAGSRRLILGILAHVKKYVYVCVCICAHPSFLLYVCMFRAHTTHRGFVNETGKLVFRRNYDSLSKGQLRREAEDMKEIELWKKKQAALKAHRSKRERKGGSSARKPMYLRRYEEMYKNTKKLEPKTHHVNAFGPMSAPIANRSRKRRVPKSSKRKKKKKAKSMPPQQVTPLNSFASSTTASEDPSSSSTTATTAPAIPHSPPSPLPPAAAAGGPYPATSAPIDDDDDFGMDEGDDGFAPTAPLQDELAKESSVQGVSKVEEEKEKVEDDEYDDFGMELEEEKPVSAAVPVEPVEEEEIPFKQELLEEQLEESVPEPEAITEEAEELAKDEGEDEDEYGDDFGADEEPVESATADAEEARLAEEEAEATRLADAAAVVQAAAAVAEQARVAQEEEEAAEAARVAEQEAEAARVAEQNAEAARVAEQEAEVARVAAQAEEAAAEAEEARVAEEEAASMPVQVPEVEPPEEEAASMPVQVPEVEPSQEAPDANEEGDEFDF